MAREMKADMVVVNGKVVTMDPADRIAEAVAIRDGNILAVGSNAEVVALADEETSWLDVGGKTVLPGLIDGHTHLEPTSTVLNHNVRIHSPPVRSIADMMELMREGAEKVPPGEWVVGRGSFAQMYKLSDGRLPNRQEMDEAVPDRPAITVHSAHLMVGNSLALEALGVTRSTADLGQGTHVEMDPDTGEPTGLVKEALRKVPVKRPSREQIKEEVSRTIREMFVAQGITSVHEMPTTRGVSIYQELERSGDLPLRVTFFPMVPEVMQLDGLLDLGVMSGFGSDRLKLGGIKMFIDGGTAAEAAAMYSPYPGRPDYYGLLKATPEQLTERVTKAHEAGLQVWMHAVGERAQDMALDAIEHGMTVAPNADHRHRMEHSANAFCSPERIARYHELGAIPSANSQFIHAIGFAMERFYEEKAKVVFPYKTLLDAGIRVPNGSDSTGTQPEAINPFWGIWCCVARESYDGSLISPEESISVLDALRMVTVHAAHGAFEEDVKGSIEPGKFADMVVISDDILSVPADVIKDITVEKTIIGGEVVYSAE